VRRRTEGLAEPLSAEDCQVQSMPDASPTKWHLAHTSWFFETFVLDGAPADPAFAFLFNSYYEAVGPRHPRAARGLLSRPSLDEVRRYRRQVDERMAERLARGVDDDARGRVVLGLAHEEQHQELILTDVKHLLGGSPLRPAYRQRDARTARGGGPAPGPLTFVRQPGGLVPIGHAAPGASGEPFAFDNEAPRHEVLLRPYALAARLVTAGEYLAFIRDGGYRRPELWLSDGWAELAASGAAAPLYWRVDGDAAWLFTLDGERPLDPAEPVAHVSYYEADAYARWADARLPTEAEWEAAATAAPPAAAAAGNFLESNALHPRAARVDGDGGFTQLFGDAWEWTASAYAPYPGYRAAAGALGEYNGKFMCNQMVLRGGSCLTPRGHVRPSYRNFFSPAARWQMTGIRLARDL
jgi:ergothioneine biosynthesis protein EgtB